MKCLRTGEKVKYISDVQKDYTGQICIATAFELEHRMIALKCSDGQIIVAYWDEVEVVEDV